VCLGQTVHLCASLAVHVEAGDPVVLRWPFVGSARQRRISSASDMLVLQISLAVHLKHGSAWGGALRDAMAGVVGPSNTACLRGTRAVSIWATGCTLVSTGIGYRSRSMVEDSHVILQKQWHINCRLHRHHDSRVIAVWTASGICIAVFRVGHGAVCVGCIQTIAVVGSAALRCEPSYWCIGCICWLAPSRPWNHYHQSARHVLG
jgi:hypothetical protein